MGYIRRNSDENSQANQEALAQIPVSRLLTELFRCIAIDESDVSTISKFDF